MQKNLQALEQLEKSAKEQEQRLQNLIVKTHKQSLEKLNKSLINIHSTKLDSSLENIDYELEQIRRWKAIRWLIGGTTIGILLTIGILYLTTESYQVAVDEERVITAYSWKWEK